MEQGEDFTYTFTMEAGSFTSEVYESLRTRPQTRICYAQMQDGSLKVLRVQIINLPRPPEPELIPWMVELKWQCQNEINNG